ncbi:MAG: PQQ-binding-like beta-propeller repeat protein, partial [Polyangiales bacterium]
DGGTGLSVSPLVAADSTLRVLTDDQGGYLVLALDGGFVESFPAFSGTRGSASIGANGDLYVATNVGELIDLSSAGIKQWSASVSNDFSPVVFGPGTEIFTSDNRQQVYAVDRADGGVLWTRPLVSDAGVSEIPTLAFAVDGTLRAVVAATPDAGATVFSIDPALGLVRWARQIGGAGEEINGVALADDGTVYVSGQSGLYSVTSDGGLGVANVGARPAGIILDAHGDVFAITHDLRLVAYHGDSLSESWGVSVPDAGALSAQDTPVIGPQQRVYVLLTDRIGVSLLAAFEPSTLP